MLKISKHPSLPGVAIFVAVLGIVATAIGFGKLLSLPPSHGVAGLLSLPPSKEVVTEESQPMEYPGGVTYFPWTGETYQHALGRFIEEHPGLNCEYAGPASFYPDPHIRGHIFVCTDIAQNAQDQTVQ